MVRNRVLWLRLNRCPRLKVYFLTSISKVGTLFLIKASLILHRAGCWKNLLNALLYATRTLCNCVREKSDHKCAQWKFVQYARNKRLFTLYQLVIWNVHSLIWLYNDYCLPTCCANNLFGTVHPHETETKVDHAELSRKLLWAVLNMSLLQHVLSGLILR